MSSHTKKKSKKKHAIEQPAKKRTKIIKIEKKIKKKQVTKNHDLDPDRPEIKICTKRLVDEKNHVFIHMIGTGRVKLDLVLQKMKELQEIMDNIETKPHLQFTFIFDFRNLMDFVDYQTVFKFGKFMNDNKPLFEKRLRRSHLLLKYWSWRATVKLLFMAFPPTKEVVFDIDENIDEAICK